MSLGSEIHEWRKQMVEKLLTDGRNMIEIEKQVNAAELLVFGDYIIDVNIQCPIKHSSELKNLLLDFSQKNGCLITATPNTSIS